MLSSRSNRKRTKSAKCMNRSISNIVKITKTRTNRLEGSRVSKSKCIFHRNGSRNGVAAIELLSCGVDTCTFVNHPKVNRNLFEYLRRISGSLGIAPTTWRAWTRQGNETMETAAVIRLWNMKTFPLLYESKLSPALHQSPIHPLLSC